MSERIVRFDILHGLIFGDGYVLRRARWEGYFDLFRWQSEPPNPAMPMDQVVAHDPIAKVKRSVRRSSHAGRPKFGVALYDHLARREVRGAARNKLITLDAVIAPARHP